MLSFWEKDQFLKYDHIIIGGGIVGLSTAISIKEKNEDTRVLILERGIFPTGASTKNAGFACFGSLSEILADRKTMTDDEVVSLVMSRWEGLKLLRKRLGDKDIDYQNHGGYEILKHEELHLLDHLAEINDLLHPVFGKEVYSDRSNEIKNLGFAPVVEGLIYNPFEAQIHTGKMMKSLISLARRLDIEMLTGVEVNDFKENADEVLLSTNKSVQFSASKIAICTNAFSKKLLPELALSPGRGVVLITKPIDGLKLKGTFHYNEGFYYFRNYEDRVLFGGGRNLDLEGEKSIEFEVRDFIVKKLESDLKEFIIPGQPIEIDHVWIGIMAFGPNKQPVVKNHSDRVVLGLRLGGMGVALGSKVGEQLARMMLC